MQLNQVWNNRERFLPYLLLADESEAIVRAYIHDGDLYEIKLGGEVAGVVLFVPENKQVIELKNMALLSVFRGKGIGKKVIHEAAKILSQKGYQTLTVGTANSSIENLAFYQKAGFRISGIKKDFFLKYPEPIIENGIRALDMIMFERKI
ncbi:putative N-acetyltransferase YvbK [Bacillus sp. THAF10]|uniref:GNAT family N-acetyltransferase n=1 Tax=Bacillus sp. THAF10 TaxID=2587848 RepID=UPI001268A620|nr:GNAT family N-acetyltransferase [Bacillus sp. THAF10]QFT87530.1 putative N-acetyltransferase YvbK [Bacillus sp. THAF10]